jgi:hypothetical protein
MDSAKALALKGCVTDEVNQNLTSTQKLLLRFHFRLGHIGFQHVPWLGRQGLLGPEGVTMGNKSNLTVPKCAACQFGKQGRTPTQGRRVTFANSGACCLRIKSVRDNKSSLTNTRAVLLAERLH